MRRSSVRTWRARNVFWSDVLKTLQTFSCSVFIERGSRLWEASQSSNEWTHSYPRGRPITTLLPSAVRVWRVMQSQGRAQCTHLGAKKKEKKKEASDKKSLVWMDSRKECTRASAWRGTFRDEVRSDGRQTRATMVFFFTRRLSLFGM